MSTRSVVKKTLVDQSGIALVVTLAALVVLLVLSLGVLQNAVSGLRTAANDSSAKSALAIADAGVEFGRETLRSQLEQRANYKSLSEALKWVANGKPLVDATQRSQFSGTTGSSNGTLNRPLVTSRNFASGWFQVFLTNDRNDVAGATPSANVTSQTDNNSNVMLTSFGTSPSGALAVVQETVKLFTGFFPGPHLPGVIVMPGPNVVFGGPNSNRHAVNGQDSNGQSYPTVAVSTQAALNSVIANIGRASDFTSGNSFDSNTTVPSLENFLASSPGNPNPYDNSTNNPSPGYMQGPNPSNQGRPGDPSLISVSYLTNLVNTITAAADYAGSASGFDGNLGTTTQPRIVAITGDMSVKGNVSGAGILLVTGQLYFKGTPSYNGVILVIGTGSMVIDGGGNGDFYGAILIANTNTPWSANPAYVGTPSYQDNGGGNATQQYDSASLTGYASPIMPLQLVSYQELR